MAQNMLEHLQKSIESAVKREGPKFAEKHIKYGFWSNPFSDYKFPMNSNFENLFVNRKDNIENISNYLVGSFLSAGEDTAVISPIGFGCRSMVNFFTYFLRSLEKKDIPKTHYKIKERFSDIVYYDAHTIGTNLLEEIKKKIEDAINNKKMVVMTSSFESRVSLIEGGSESTTERFKRLLALDIRSKEKTIFLSPWNASVWLYMEENYPLPISIYEKKEVLKPLNTEETIKLLKLRMEECEHTDKAECELFDDEALKAIAKFSGGIPRFALQFAHDLLEYAIKVGRKEPLTSKIIQSELNKEGFYSYEDIKNKLKKLIPDPKPWQKKPKAEKVILKTMIYLSGRDVTSTEIGKQIGKSRVAVFTNLRKLEKEKLVEREKIEAKDSRRRPYKINDFVRSVFENEFVIPEIKKKI